MIAPTENYHARLIETICIALTVIVGLAIIWQLNKRTNFLCVFFSKEGSPLNLAVCRVVVFSCLLLFENPLQARWYSSLPTDLQFPPVGWQFVLGHLPVNERVVDLAAVVFYVSCALSIIGLWSRWAKWLAVLATIYVLGVPQFYGKVNHSHHEVWFAIILAMSDCSDVLSVDAILLALRCADQGSVAARGPSKKYSLPIRCIWVLFGAVYLFPGLWKLYAPGWFTSDRLKGLLYDKWVEYPGWTPMIRIDQMPTVLAVLASGAVLFEVGFSVAILLDRTRPFAVVAGLLFHNITNGIMRISFLTLQYMYLVFLDWASIFDSYGRRQFPNSMTVYYDLSSEAHRRIVSVLNVLDLTHRVDYSNGPAPEPRFQAPDLETKRTWMVGYIDRNRLSGLEVYVEIAKRNPLLWLAVPVLRIAPRLKLGKTIRQKPANSARQKVSPKWSRPFANEISSEPSRLLRVGASTLIGLVLLAGVSGVESSWPIAVYPKFVYTPTSERVVLVLEYRENSELVARVLNDDKLMNKNFGSERWEALIKAISKTHGVSQSRRFDALWVVMQRIYPTLRTAHNPHFLYRAVKRNWQY